MLNIIKLRLALLLGGTFLILSAYAQDDVSIYSRLKEKYPNESVVQISKSVNYKIKLEKNDLSIKLFTKDKLIFLKNVSVFNSDKSVYSSSFIEFEDYEANSYVLNNHKYEKIAVKEYMANLWVS